MQAQAANYERRYNEEVDALEKAKEQELALVGDNEAERTKVEEKFAAEREKIDLAYKKKQKAAAVKQAIIDGALAIVKSHCLGSLAGQYSGDHICHSHDGREPGGHPCAEIRNRRHLPARRHFLRTPAQGWRN